MKRMLMTFAVVGLFASSARADTIPEIVGLPGTYTPGTSFTFEVRVPGLPDFSGFAVQLVFETTVPNPDLTITAVAGAGQYPFTDASNFTLNQTAPDPGATFFSATITGSGPLTFTTAGTNDLLAFVTVNPGTNLTGPITVSIGGETVLIYNMEGRNDSPPEPAIVQQADLPPPSTTPVPAPAGAVLLGLGGLLLAARNRLLR